MKFMTLQVIVAAVLLTGAGACNNNAPDGTATDTHLTSVRKSEDSLTLHIKDITIPDRAWVRQCQDAFKGIFVSPSLPDNAPGNDGVINRNAYSFGTAFSKTAFVDWVNQMASNTNCDRFMIRYGIYPPTGRPAGVPASGLAHLKPNRMTCFVWAYHGDKPATYTTKSGGDTTDPYNLGEIHP